MKTINPEKLISTSVNLAATIYDSLKPEILIMEKVPREDFVKLTSIAIMNEILVLLINDCEQAAFNQWIHEILKPKLNGNDSQAFLLLLDCMKNKDFYHKHLLHSLGENYDQTEMENMVCAGIGLWILVNLLGKEWARSHNQASFSIGQLVRQRAANAYHLYQQKE